MANTKLSALTTRGTPDRVNDLLYVTNGGASYKSTPNNLLGITGAPVGTTDSQSLTNKTLTAPTISSPVLSGTLTGTYTLAGTPTFPSSVVTLTGTQTLTNKTLTSATLSSPTLTNASITADNISGFTTSTSGNIYGVAIASGVFTSNNVVPNNSLSNTGTFGSAWAWQSWSPTITGFSANPTGATYFYTQIGKTIIATVRQPNTGTSNATAFTITMPTTASANSQSYLVPCLVADNGSTVTSPGLVRLDASSNVANVFKDYGSTVFTASGGKRVNFTIIYETA